jgi:hypothetical protein
VIDDFGIGLLGWTDDALALVQERRGWTEEAIERLGLEWLPGEQLVGIPIHDESGDRCEELLRYDPTGKRKPKMHAPIGVPRQLFPPPELIRDDELDERRTVWLVEGEADAIRLRSLGLVAVAIPGAQNWRDEWAARFVGRGWRIIACFDCDEAGRNGAARVAASIVNAGGDARLLDLAPHRDGGYDLTDFTASANTPALRAETATLLRDCADRLELYRPVEPIENVSDEEFAAVEFSPIEAFVAHPVPQAEPIVVDATGATAFAADGFGLTYGDGGAGKTTLWLDAALHFATGDDWLDGRLTPTRPLRVGWIENEGPQEEFRRKLERKLEAWKDRLPPGRLHVLRAPWGALDLRDARHREGIAAAVRNLELDLLFGGPVVDLGMVGGGTPDEVRAFHGYLKDVQTLARRHVSLMLLHHENTAGRVSGAWTGRPDLLVHVQAQGNGKTRVIWQKAKWSSSLHGTTDHLRWRDQEGFERAEPEPNRAERTWDGIEAYVLAHGGTSWTPVEQNVTGGGPYLRRRRDAMLGDGVLINTGRGGEGVPQVLWHRDDPDRPTLDTTVSEQGHGGDTVASTTGNEEGEATTVSPRPLRSRDAEKDAVAPPFPADTGQEPAT